jgi:DNA-binding response OmpR family regulator
MTTKLNLLVIDDDPVVRKLLKHTLDTGEYNVLMASNGNQAVEILNRELVDLALIDIKMPGMDGFTVCRVIRESSSLPVIMLTAVDSVDEKVKAFECGADDYITKPFAPRELVSRVKAVLRRVVKSNFAPEIPNFKQGRMEIDFVKRKVKVEGKPLDLTATEYELLKTLVINRGKVLTHEYLLKSVWGEEYGDEAQYLHEYISHLRKRLGFDPLHAAYITTVFGVGYIFNE